jgi:hypothetical protein
MAGRKMQKPEIKAKRQKMDWEQNNRKFLPECGRREILGPM